MNRRTALSALLLAGLCLPAAAFAQNEGPYQTRVIVRSKSGSALQAADLQVEHNGKDAPVVRLTPLIRPSTQPVEVAILIDDGLRANFGNQLRDIQSFVRGIASPQVSVGVGYMQNGRVVFGSGFSSDPDTVGKGVRATLQSPGISGSPYFALQDLLKHWPTSTGAPRVVLMITNGLDLYNGPPVPQNQNSPYVDAAIRDAQRANVPVYSIYFGSFEVNGNLSSMSGQSYLANLGDDTGGELFNSGTINPPGISPYLKRFDRDLRSSYLLTFQTGTSKLERLKVSSKSGAKLAVQREAGQR